MSAGLIALLDDVAALAKMAAASVDDVAAAAGRASAKAAGVVVDDTAVTPQYVRGMDPSRELPVIKRIAVGSLRNKLLIILPIALLLSQFLPWALTPVLMLGGSYLCYEGAEKIWEKFFGGHHAEEATPAVVAGPEAENSMVRQAITTDFILSAEIMVIALNEVAESPFVQRAIILAVVAVLITFLVYGVVGLLVKMDDIGLKLAERPSAGSQRFGKALVSAMPKVMNVISIVGTFAMLWVGGHIILVGLADLGWHAPYDLVHHLEEPVRGIASVGGALGWLVNTFFSMVLGLIWGMVLVGVMHVLPVKKHGAPEADEHARSAADATAGERAATVESAPRSEEARGGAHPYTVPEDTEDR